MMLNSGRKGWASHYGPTNRNWLQEEFDGLGGDRQHAKVPSVAQAYAEDAAARLHTWADEADYDEPGAGSGGRERTGSFPDPRVLINRDWEK